MEPRISWSRHLSYKRPGFGKRRSRKKLQKRANMLPPKKHRKVKELPPETRDLNMINILTAFLSTSLFFNQKKTTLSGTFYLVLASLQAKQKPSELLRRLRNCWSTAPCNGPSGRRRCSSATRRSARAAGRDGFRCFVWGGGTYLFFLVKRAKRGKKVGDLEGRYGSSRLRSGGFSIWSSGFQLCMPL